MNLDQSFNKGANPVKIFNRARLSKEQQPVSDTQNSPVAENKNDILTRNEAESRLHEAEQRSREEKSEIWQRLDTWHSDRGGIGPFNFLSQRFDLIKREKINPVDDERISTEMNITLDLLRRAGDPVIDARDALIELSQRAEGEAGERVQSKLGHRAAVLSAEDDRW